MRESKGGGGVSGGWSRHPRKFQINEIHIIKFPKISGSAHENILPPQKWIIKDMTCDTLDDDKL